MNTAYLPEHVCRWFAILAFIISAAFACAQTTIPNGDKAVAVGSTEGEVVQIMGNPRGKMRQGNGAIWLYSDSEISFQNGKVISVKSVVARPQPAPVAAVPSARSTLPAARQAVVAPASAVTRAVVAQASPPATSLPPGAGELKVMWSDPQGTTRSRISCTFGMPILSEQALQAQKQKGMVPFRITVSVLLSPPAGTDNREKWELVRTGPCLVRLFDEKNVEVLTLTLQADKLCPS